MTKTITIGMIGAGRGAELHMGGYDRVHDIHIRYKWIFARREEQLLAAQKRYGFERITTRLADILEDPEVDVVDLCTPPYMHVEEVILALKHGKHVICEKPLTGYFGSQEDPLPIGHITKEKMYHACMKDLKRVEEAIEKSGKKFMYAESLKGSSSAVAGEWSKTGGGTFIRTGTHPLTAMLWLKQQEARAAGTDIHIKSVLADMACVTAKLTAYEHRHIAAKPQDVEDTGTCIIEFTDGTRAVVIACDTLLGGSRNYVELYCNDAAINCTLTLNNLMSTYLLDEEGLDDISFSEMLPSKCGWNHPFISDEIIRGYTNEIQDFMESIANDREPKSGFALARDTVKIVYAAYLSAEQGRRVLV